LVGVFVGVKVSVGVLVFVGVKVSVGVLVFVGVLLGVRVARWGGTCPDAGSANPAINMITITTRNNKIRMPTLFIVCPLPYVKSAKL
jgi:hypothetical protein